MFNCPVFLFQWFLWWSCIIILIFAPLYIRHFFFWLLWRFCLYLWSPSVWIWYAYVYGFFVVVVCFLCVCLLWHLPCLLFAELPEYVVWYLPSTWGNSQQLLSQIILFVFLFILPFSYVSFKVFLQFRDILFYFFQVFFVFLCFFTLEVILTYPQGQRFLFSYVHPTNEPIKVILLLLQCFWSLKFIFDSYIAHMFMHAICFVHWRP